MKTDRTGNIKQNKCSIFIVPRQIYVVSDARTVDGVILEILITSGKQSGDGRR
jgi:hypothetical protein